MGAILLCKDPRGVTGLGFRLTGNRFGLTGSPPPGGGGGLAAQKNFFAKHAKNKEIHVKNRKIYRTASENFSTDWALVTPPRGGGGLPTGQISNLQPDLPTTGSRIH